MRVSGTALRRVVEGAADRVIPVRWDAHREQLLYLVVGAWNTLFGYCVWATLETWLGPRVNYFVVILLAYPIAIANAYAWYRYVVFRSHARILAELPRFSLVYLATMVANLVALPFLLRILPFNVYAVQGLFTLAVVVISYVGHRHFSFAGRQKVPAGRTLRSVRR